jgi:cytoskeletal protein RodZ
MLIAILVLLGLAGAIWYFARKQTHAAYSLTADQTAELNRQIDRDAALATAATEPAPAPTSPSVEQINTALADVPVVEEPVTPVVDPIVELPSEKVKEEIDAETPTEAPIVVNEAAPVLTTEAPKPAKKKHRYYPKNK